MKTVAILDPDSYPISMSPALWSRFFTDHLREFGRALVVTEKAPAASVYSKAAA